jgi:ubiquinone/menaquinone biosynthesis C-methylase UbiE
MSKGLTILDFCLGTGRSLQKLKNEYVLTFRLS